MEFTKWHVELLPVTRQLTVRDEGGNLIAGGMLKENAHLIAAAPELYEACKVTLRQISVWQRVWPNHAHYYDSVKTMLEEAIAKVDKGD